MRIRSQWFKDGAAKTPEQNASAVAFIAWRVAQNTLKQMRQAQFDINIGAQYFAFTREVLTFLLLIVERLAYTRMDAEQRMAFMTALVIRSSEILEENEDMYLGAPDKNSPSYSETFIDLYNEVAGHYSEFDFDEKSEDKGPDFGFVRYLGHRVEKILPEKDRLWVIDQFMAIEVPEAVQTLARGVNGVLGLTPKGPRAHSRTSGD